MVFESFFTYYSDLTAVHMPWRPCDPEKVKDVVRLGK